MKEVLGLASSQIRIYCCLSWALYKRNQNKICVEGNLMTLRDNNLNQVDDFF